jgi:SAM-dependent methyltransferase
MEMDTASFLESSIPKYLVHAPISLCLRELNRLLAIRSLDAEHYALRGKILDVGCGDGFWWTCLDREGREVYGVDISKGEIEQARRNVDHVETLDVSRQIPFGGIRFETIIGNCSLEHIPNIDGALHNLREAAASRSLLVLFVPTPTWAIQGQTQGFLMRYFPRLGMAFAGALNGFFQHWHIYDYRVWSSILRSNGWYTERVYGLGGRRSELLFRLFLPTGFLSFLVKSIVGVYPNRMMRYLPRLMLAPFIALIKNALAKPLVEPGDPGTYEYMILARAGELHDH